MGAGEVLHKHRVMPLMAVMPTVVSGNCPVSRVFIGKVRFQQHLLIFEGLYEPRVQQIDMA